MDWVVCIIMFVLLPFMIYCALHFGQKEKEDQKDKSVLYVDKNIKKEIMSIYKDDLVAHAISNPSMYFNGKIKSPSRIDVGASITVENKFISFKKDYLLYSDNNMRYMRVEIEYKNCIFGYR